MKFCVFATNKNRKFLNISARSNLSYNNADFYISLKAYSNIVESGMFKKVFFLVDFGMEKDNPFIFRGVKYDEYNLEFIPWLLITKNFTEDPDNVEGIPTKIVLKLKGFKEEFTDPIEAMKRYEYYIEQSIKCSLHIDIDGSSDIFVSNTQDDIYKNRFVLKNFYCKKYRIKG